MWREISSRFCQPVYVEWTEMDILKQTPFCRVWLASVSLDPSLGMETFAWILHGSLASFQTVGVLLPGKG